MFVAGIVLGSVDLPPATTLGILANRLGFDVPVTWPPTSEAIVIDLRLPRVLTAMVVGTGLAVAGATFQGLLRNPLADPYVLGTASGPRWALRSRSSSRPAAWCSSSGC